MRTVKSLLILSFLSIMFVSTAQEHDIKTELIFTDAVEHARLQHIKSVLDTQENIHLVFMANDRQLMYGSNTSGSWKFKKLWYVDKDYNDTTSVVYYPNISVDKNNTIHITMFGRYGEKLYYAKKPASGGEFIFEEAIISPEPLRFLIYGDYTDMAVDKNNGLHLICRADYTDQQDFKYNQCAVYLNKPANSDKWNLQVLVHDPDWDVNNIRFGTNSSIACYGDKVFVVLGGDNDLHFCSRNISGGPWDIENLINTPDNVVNSQKYNTSLAISPEGTIKFAFYDRSEEENAPWQGLTIFSQGECGSKEWIGYNEWEWPNRLNCPAMAINRHGKAYLALGQNGFALYEQVCDCSGEYKEIFLLDNNSGDYVDMNIDSHDIVHVFYTSGYDNHLHYLIATPGSNLSNCNYPPKITGYTGKTNVGPGEEWTGTVSASDYECDKIDFYSIILPEQVNIVDHGNGTATIHAKIPEGEGFGDVGFTIFARDASHQDINNHVSAITFMLKLTQEGSEEGHVKVENKCYE